MMHAPDGDDEYVALLRERLPSEGDKERMRKRLAALGVGSGAALVPASSQAQALAAKWSLGGLSKVLLSAAGLAAVTSALYLTLGTSTAPVKPSARPRSQPAPIELAPPSSSVERHGQGPGEDAAKPSELPREPSDRKAREGARSADPLDTLSRENALLGAAVRAIHAGKLRRAERLLAEHERRFPHGVLRDERERARKKLEQATKPE